MNPVTIPITSRHRYIGGMAALNIPSIRGTGDWHMEQTFFRPRNSRSRSFISGEGCLTNTLSILGDSGVFECSEQLKELGIPYEGECVYAANHARAIADLVLGAIMRGVSADFVVLDDWMHEEKDKCDVFDLLETSMQGICDENRIKVIEWMDENKR